MGSLRISAKCAQLKTISIAYHDGNFLLQPELPFSSYQQLESLQIHYCGQLTDVPSHLSAGSQTPTASML